MSSLIITAVVVVVVVIVIGAAILTCALGWNRLIPGWSRKSKKDQWPTEKYPYPSRYSVETDWVGSPIMSPASSPVASPRASRQSSDLTTKTNASMREVV
ncbi:hypothetical protein SCUP234_12485 [Seiridium cupressi]